MPGYIKLILFLMLGTGLKFYTVSHLLLLVTLSSMSRTWKLDVNVFGYSFLEAFMSLIPLCSSQIPLWICWYLDKYKY